MNRSMPGLPVHQQLPEFTQTHARRVGDAIQPSHPLSSPSPPAPNHSQHHPRPWCQLFAWGGQNTGVSASASVLPMNTRDWSPLGWTGWISFSPRDSQVFSNNTVQKHQIFSGNLMACKLHGWMASPNRWTWVWVNSRRWWWIGRPGMLRFMGSQRVGHDWVTELNWSYRSSNLYILRLYPNG